MDLSLIEPKTGGGGGGNILRFRFLILCMIGLLVSSGARACDAGHWIGSVSDDGIIIKLEDGSIYEVSDVDAATSALWLPTTEIVACDDKLINTDDGETVEATQIK